MPCSLTALTAQSCLDAVSAVQGCSYQYRASCTADSAEFLATAFMPLVLNYRFTFIDAADSEQAAQDVWRRRALTPPPRRPGRLSHLGEDALAEEVEAARCRDYLNGLTDGCGPLACNGGEGEGASNRMPSGSKEPSDAASDAQRAHRKR